VTDSVLSLGINKKCNEMKRIMPTAAAEARDIRNKNYTKRKPKFYYGNKRMRAKGRSKRL